VESIAEQSLREFVKAIASNEPAPGSGAAAGAALAIGVACARKAVAITMAHGTQSPLDDAACQLSDMADQALRLGDRDADCFRALIGHDENAAEKLVDTGLQLLDLAARAQDCIMGIHVDPVMRNDLFAAHALIECAVMIVRANLAENEAQSSGSSRSEAVR
jgi:hypothetical protein